MKDFTERWRQLDWEDIRLRIHSKTAADVQQALNKSRLNREDLMALLSPPPPTFLNRWRKGAAPDASAFRQYRQLLCPALPFQPVRQRLHLLRLP